MWVLLVLAGWGLGCTISAWTHVPQALGAPNTQSGHEVRGLPLARGSKETASVSARAGPQCSQGGGDVTGAVRPGPLGRFVGLGLGPGLES